MNGKVITQEQIDALPNYVLPIDGGDGDYNFKKSTDIRAIYDNAPSVGGEPLGYVYANENKVFEEYGIRFNLELAKKDFEKCFVYKDGRIADNSKIVALYTTPQPDREAQLEAKLKEYEEAIKAMVEDGWLLCGHEGLSEPQQKVYDAYQAMKG